VSVQNCETYPSAREKTNKLYKAKEKYKIFSRTTGPEKLKFIWKLSDTVQNQIS
jgi:hypothetical protein